MTEFTKQTNHLRCYLLKGDVPKICREAGVAVGTLYNAWGADNYQTLQKKQRAAYDAFLRRVEDNLAAADNIQQRAKLIAV